MTGAIDIRPYRPGDEDELVALFARCFGRERTLAHWRWKMQPCREGVHAMWVAATGDRIVGQYVGSPLPARIGGAPCTAMSIFDAMVDPGFRRRGLLTRLGQAANEHWRSAGVAFAFGLPNEQWGSRTTALGWLPLCEFPWLVRILRPEAILARRMAWPSLASVGAIGSAWRTLSPARRVPAAWRFEQPDTPVAELDDIAGAAQPAAIHICRGSRWVRRRYLECPDVDYRVLLARHEGRPAGYAVVRFDGAAGGRATITEVVVTRDVANARLAVLAGIEGLCLSAGVASTRALAVPGTDLHASLTEAGYRQQRYAFGLQCVPFTDAAQQARAAADWHFDGGDFDVV